MVFTDPLYNVPIDGHVCGLGRVRHREFAMGAGEMSSAGFTQGRGVDKIVHSAGGSILDRSFETIRRLGHVVSYGEAEGRPYPNLWERLVRKSLTLAASTSAMWIAAPKPGGRARGK